MPRPSKTIPYPLLNSDIYIVLTPHDTVKTFKTNISGNIRTNVVKWDKHQATVLLGEVNILKTRIAVPKETKIFSCVVYGRGIISSIGIMDQEVTVIIH